MNTALLSKARARVIWTAEERAEWLRLIEQSGQTAADFCRDNGLSPATLSVWRQQLPEAEPGEASLVEIPREVLSLSDERAGAQHGRGVRHVAQRSAL